MENQNIDGFTTLCTSSQNDSPGRTSIFCRILNPGKKIQYGVSDHVKLSKSEHRRTLPTPLGFIKFTLHTETVYIAGISRIHQVSM